MTDEPFTLPSPEMLAGEVREFRFDKHQFNNLYLAVQHAHGDLEGFDRARITRPERRAMLGDLQDVRSALGSLIVALRAISDRDGKEALPSGAREAIAQTISSKLIFEATGRKVTDDHGVRLSHAVDSAGLDQGASIWLAQLKRIDAPISAFFEEDTPDPGGREPDYVRYHLIGALADFSRNYLRQDPTPTRDAPFYRLVNSVFDACGLPEEGRDNVLDRALTAWRRRA